MHWTSRSSGTSSERSLPILSDFASGAESSKDLLRRWQAMYQVQRADPELGFREQIEAADTLDADPYTRLRLLLLEKGTALLFSTSGSLHAYFILGPAGNEATQHSGDPELSAAPIGSWNASQGGLARRRQLQRPGQRLKVMAAPHHHPQPQHLLPTPAAAGRQAASAEAQAARVGM